MDRLKWLYVTRVAAAALIGLFFLVVLVRLTVPNRTVVAEEIAVRQSHGTSETGGTRCKEPPSSSRKDDSSKQEADGSSLDSVKVVFWVMTSPSTLQTKGSAVRATWGQRCEKLLFMSSKSEPSQPNVIGLPVKEGRAHLLSKTRHAFKYLYDHHLEEFDWFFKADDDTYVFVENLKRLLVGYDPDKPLFFGMRFNMQVSGGYTSGGAGYVLSREALRRLGSKGQDSKKCRQDGGDEDVEIGRCMHSLGVKLGNSKDSKERSRFHCFEPKDHIEGNWTGNVNWYRRAVGNVKGLDSMSDEPISFHYLSPTMMYQIEYFSYRVNRMENLVREPNKVHPYYTKKGLSGNRKS